MAQIARRLGMGRASVRWFAATATCPERVAAPPQSRMLDPYCSYRHAVYVVWRPSLNVVHDAAG